MGDAGRLSSQSTVRFAPRLRLNRDHGGNRALGGDTAAGLIVLRDYINATIGFSALSKAMHVHEKSLMRMVGPRGNPRAANLFAMVGALQKRTHIEARIETLTAEFERGEREASEHVNNLVETLMEDVTSKNRAAEAVRGPVRRAPAQRPAAKRRLTAQRKPC